MSSEKLMALADEWDRAEASSRLGSLHAAGIVAGLRLAADQLRTIAASAESAEGPVWLRGRPTSAGVYGVRGYEIGVDDLDQYEAIVRVVEYEGELICNLHEVNSNREFEDWSLISDFSEKFEWCQFRYDDRAATQEGLR